MDTAEKFHYGAYKNDLGLLQALILEHYDWQFHRTHTDWEKQFLKHRVVLPKERE